ncbi:MAG: nucleotidyltransferase domain-containing protein [Ignavibacteriales bacterium]|nr:nucleotidyltransferase domain-containing protein [Ignavibacteriales bacterium]
MISKKIIKNIVNEIVDACDPELVILFGSYGRGKPKKDSDLDIFIVAELPGSSIDRIRFVRNAIKENGFGLDVVTRTPQEYSRALKGRDWFIQEIAREGKILYAR